MKNNSSYSFLNRFSGIDIASAKAAILIIVSSNSISGVDSDTIPPPV